MVISTKDFVISINARYSDEKKCSKQALKSVLATIANALIASSIKASNDDAKLIAEFHHEFYDAFMDGFRKLNSED